MEQDTTSPATMAELLARAGIAVTDEGRSRARRRLAEADASRDRGARAAFLADLREGRAAPA